MSIIYIMATLFGLVTIVLGAGFALRTVNGDRVVPGMFPVLGIIGTASILMLPHINSMAIIALVIAALLTAAVVMKASYKPIFMATVAFGLVAMTTGAFSFIAPQTPEANQADGSSQQASEVPPVVETENGQQMPYVGNEDNANQQPLIGAQAVNDEAPASLQCEGNLNSLQEWVKCVDSLPKEKADNYKAFINDHQDSFPGGWNAIVKKAKQGDKGQLVIQLFNTDMTDKAARAAAAQDIGKIALTSNVIRMPKNTAIMNSRGVQSGHVQAFADARPMVRVALTTDAKRASQGKSAVFVDCKNPQTGITKSVPPKRVKQVQPPAPPAPPAPPVQKKTPPPVTKTTTPPPPVTTTPPTTPPTETKTTTPPPPPSTTTPPTTPPTETKTTTTPPPNETTTTPPPPPSTTTPPTTPPTETKTTTPPPPPEKTTPPPTLKPKDPTQDAKPPAKDWTPAPAPSTPADKAPPVEERPAPPPAEKTPDAPAPADVKVPGNEAPAPAKEDPAPPPAPIEQAPAPSDPGTSSGDPDQAGLGAIGFLPLLGTLLLSRKRRNEDLEV